ncbi:MAG TPA: hypothetical protein P5055_16500, partial [Candidatus Paceibacterota bacterium]|nr:hypothetical protein [Candidatus Paceibacterota bacterium]
RRAATLIQTRNPVAARPRFTAWHWETDGSLWLELECSSLRGLACSLQSSADLAGWQKEWTLSVTNDTFQWMDRSAPALDRRFYRLGLP